MRWIFQRRGAGRNVIERGGMGARASTSPARTGTSKPVDPKKHAETSKKVVDLVRQQIMAKYGKGALM